MEMIRWPKGGLNVDDSIELVDPEDWIDATNIVDGRSVSAKNGEKENVRGTTPLSLTVDIVVEENNTFLDWVNTGEGEPWVISATPAVIDIPGSSTSKRLTYTPNTVITGWFPVSFKYSIANFPEATFSIYCLINNGSEVVQGGLVTTPSGQLDFLFNSETPITEVSIYVVTGENSAPTLNANGGGPSYENLPTTWGFAASYGTTSRSSLYQTDGNYSLKYKKIASNLTEHSVTRYAVAKLSAADAPTGKKVLLSAKVLTPSSNQIDQNSFELYIEPVAFMGSFTIVTNVNATVASCLNTWQEISAEIDIVNPANADVNFYVAIKDPSAINSNFTAAEGEIYVDEFYLTGEVAPQTVTLSDITIRKISSLSDLLDGNSLLIGQIRSAKDSLNYLFFYNTDPEKHCIIKQEEDDLSLVLKWSGLNFSPLKAHRIQGAIADELLYFTDNRNEPRCVHENRYESGGTPVNEQEILWIKRGPLAPPLFTKQTTSGYLDIKYDLQFSYQYIYVDGQQSVLSPWTKLCRIESATDTFNDVAITLNSSELVPSNVSKIKYIVRRANSGTPTVFAERALSDETAVTYHIGTDGEVVESLYIKNFENIPILAKNATVSQGRAWLGNYTEGYDTPLDLTLDYSFEETTNSDEGPVFDPNSSRKLSAVLFDGNGRSCGVIPMNASISIPGTVGHEAFRRRLQFRLTGTPPPWAKSWSMVVTDDLIKSSYVSGILGPDSSGLSSYVIVDKDDVETSTPTTWTTDVKYIKINIIGLNKNGIFYSHKPGDQLIIDDAFLGGYAGPMEIIKQVGSYIYVKGQNIGSLMTLSVNRYQIFTPSAAFTGAYYEIGHSEPIVAGAFNTAYSYWDGPSVQTTFTNGASTYLPAQMSYRNDGTWHTDFGRLNIITERGQVYKPNFFKCSSPFINGININGLSEFNLGDESSVSMEAGEIQKLQPTTKESTDGEVILAICNSDTFSIYIGESQIQSGNGSFLVASPQVIGDVRKQKSGFGTLHPESVHEEDGYVYWYDKISRSMCRYATNGIYPISEYKMVTYFEEQSSLNELEDVVVTGYDPFYKLIFVTFKNASETRKKTLGFSITKERWISFYTFAGDGYLVGKDKMYSVTGGTVHKHNNTDAYNSFYGSSGSSQLNLSFNDSPDIPKEWKALQIHTSSNFYGYTDGYQAVNTFLKAEITNRSGQMTDIESADFEVDEDLVYGEIRGDLNSPGGLLDGDSIYSKTIQCKVLFIGPEYRQLMMVKAGCEPSRGHIL